MDQILLDLRRVREVYSQGKGGTGFSWERKMTDLVGEVMTFVNARKQLMELYPVINRYYKVIMTSLHWGGILEHNPS